MGDEAQVPELIREFTTVKGRITKAQAAIQEILEKGDGALDHTDATTCETTEMKIQRAFERAGGITRDLVRLYAQAETANQIPPAKESLDDLMDAGFEILSQIKHLRLRFPEDLIDAQRRAGAPVTVKPDPDPAATTADFLKLPAQQLPKFSGIYSEWGGFWDQFDSSVNQRRMSDVHKLLYLRSCLAGEPFDLIKSLVVKNENYPTAIKIIQDRYQDCLMVEQELIDALLGAPGVQKDNPASLRKLLNIFTEKIQALKNAQVPVEGWTWGHILLKKLDPETRRTWAIFQADNQRWTPGAQVAQDKAGLVDRVMAFLLERLQAWERVGKATRQAPGTSGTPKHVGATTQQSTRQTPGASVNPPKSSALSTSCPMCKSKDHNTLARCGEFLKLDSAGRYSAVRNNSVCYNCLSAGHQVSKCNSSFTCKYCKKKHHTLLHRESTSGAATEEFQDDGDAPVGLAAIKSTASITAPGAKTKTKKGSIVFLCTVQLPCIDAGGNKQFLRAMLDTGSQVNVISADAAEKLQLPLQASDISIRGVGAGRPHRTSGRVEISIPIDGRENYKLSCDVLDKVVAELCTTRLPRRFLEKFDGYALADPTFHTASNIDVLVGMSNYNDLILPDRVAIDNLWLQHTLFGWAVTGRLSNRSEDGYPGAFLAGPVLTTTPGVHQDHTRWVTALVADNGLLEFQRFWDVEEPPALERPLLTEEERLCEEHFDRTTTRDPDGRVRVNLPFRPDAQRLGNSKAQAIKRFYSMETKLSRNPIFRAKYNEFIQEFLDTGHLELVPPDEIDIPDSQAYYMPHHGVLKESSTTTKLRVVFDASALTSTKTSLNKQLLLGPKLQEEIFKILVRFRFHKVAISGDVAKMYRQVALHEEDKDFCRLIWRSTPDSSLQVYRLTRVIYGITSSGYHAVRALQMAAQYAEDDCTRQALLRDFYVDDLMSGGDTAEDVKRLREDMIQALEKVQLPIRKWCSNSPDVLDSIPIPDREVATVEVAKDEHGVKTLGVAWNCQQDTLVFVVPKVLKAPGAFEVPSYDKKITRRKLLSAIATLYDPLGWLAPLTIKMKIVFQQTWTETSSWDDFLSPGTVQMFYDWVRELGALEFLHIPRRILDLDPVLGKDFVLCVFTDASERATAACVYVVCRDARRPSSKLLCAKTRLAPLKSQTIPRLELSAMVLGARLLTAVLQAVSNNGYTCTGVELYTDSTVALAWAKSDAGRWTTFVANRVAQIQELIKVDRLFHIPGSENPADLATRYSFQGLEEMPEWWSGPSWITDPAYLPPQPWHDTGSCPDQKKPVVASLLLEDEKPRELLPISRVSKFGRLVRITQLVLKFLRPKAPDAPTEEEAVKLLVKQEQASFYKDEIASFKRRGNVGPSSNLKKVSPFLDGDGVLRVLSRLTHSDLPSDARRPMILPHKAGLSKLLVVHIHNKLYHAGSGPVRAELQRHFWVTGSKTLIRRVIHDCVRCARFNTQPIFPLMGDLPAARVNPSPPFTHTGLDYAGPFNTKSGFEGFPDKSYLLVFVCFATKAVHLEVTNGMTVADTMEALRRFMARRGVPSALYSDNGTGLMGARRHLCELQQLFTKKWNGKTASECLMDLGINWHPIPPSAPHMGGIWEAVVKSAKGLLKRMFGDATLNVFQLTTVMCEIEAILNSRPLAPVSDDEHDLQAISPAMLLTGFKHDLFPVMPGRKPAQLAVSVYPLQRYRYLQSLISDFWTRWRSEYLAILHQREKGLKDLPNMEIGELVLVQVDNTPPAEWPLGRVISVSPGHDGRVRVVRLRMQSGELDRPVAKLRRLPVSLNRQDCD